MDDNLLSVITRLHATDRPALELLGRTMLSTAAATWSPIQQIIVTQQFSPEQLAQVQELASQFVWNEKYQPRILNYNHPDKADHRSALLNLGIQSATSQYLAILDYDDYVYEHAYETLIEQLRKSQSAIAFGGCVVAHAEPTLNGYKITHKERPWIAATVDDFLNDNIFPPNTFVIDRKRLGGKLPRINEKLTRLEDYYFLLNLRAVTTFDMTCFCEPLCEYVIRKDGTTTYQLGSELDTEENIQAWRQSRLLLKPTLQILQCLRGRPHDIVENASPGSSSLLEVF